MTKLTDPIGIMLDLETLGVTPNAVVTQVAMTAFDLSEPERIISEVVEYLPIQPQLDAGRQIDASTLTWWMRQSDVARGVFSKSDGDDPEELNALIRHIRRKFVQLTENKDYQVWARGPQFDVVMLESLMFMVKESAPWKYDSVRDLRTLMDAAGITTDDVERNPAYLPHIARYDNFYQIDCYSVAMTALGKAASGG